MSNSPQQQTPPQRSKVKTTMDNAMYVSDHNSLLPLVISNDSLYAAIEAEVKCVGTFVSFEKQQRKEAIKGGYMALTATKSGHFQLESANLKFEQNSFV